VGKRFQLGVSDIRQSLRILWSSLCKVHYPVTNSPYQPLKSPAFSGSSSICPTQLLVASVKISAENDAINLADNHRHSYLLGHCKRRRCRSWRIRQLWKGHPPVHFFRVSYDLCYHHYTAKPGTFVPINSFVSRSIMTISDTHGNLASFQIVIGGGTAGLTVARRLSEDASKKVLVVESGGSGHNKCVSESTILDQIDFQTSWLPQSACHYSQEFVFFLIH